MVDLLLHEGEQAAVRAIVASGPVPAGRVPGEQVRQHVARLIACDAIGIALLEYVRPSVESGVGIQELDHITGRDGTPADRGVAVLALGVRNGPHHVVQLWMCRRTTRFTARDRALLELVGPALERILRERPKSALPPSLTVQERRVLLNVAEGLSNADIADRLGIAPSTVGKHLENAYRKLGVSNRLAAVHAMQGSLGG